MRTPKLKITSEEVQGLGKTDKKKRPAIVKGTSVDNNLISVQQCMFSQELLILKEFLWYGGEQIIIMPDIN